MGDLRFLHEAHKIIDCIESTQGEHLHRAAEQYARTISSDGLVHLYGGGHSGVGVQETFPRIGSIVGFHPMIELALPNYTDVIGTNGLREALFLERGDGYGGNILEKYHFRPGAWMTVFSSPRLRDVVG